MANKPSSTSDISELRAVSFDYIVVGGGIGGLVVASRLSEDKDKNILLIEAGANRLGDPKIDIPGLASTTWQDPNYDWDFMSVPQVHLGGRQIPAPRGKVLGGSTAINFAAILYPSRRDFDAWTALGNSGWTAEDMAPYFHKFHRYVPASKETANLLSLDTLMDENAQGKNGPLPVTFQDVYGPFHSAWLETFKNLGFDNTADPIAGEKLGAFTPPSSIHRESSARAYATSAYYTADVAARVNLQILTETRVTKILTEKRDGSVRATGVAVYTNDDKQEVIHVTTEVILSAGALQSPQILELSGIGGKDLLETHGIPVIINNPSVGENLQDHCHAAVSFEVADGQISGDVMRDPKIIDALMKQYQETKTGPFSGIPLTMAYLPMVDVNGLLTKDDIRKLLNEYLSSEKDQIADGLKAQYEVIQKTFFDPKESTVAYGFLPAQMHHNRGKTTMKDVLSPKLPGNYVSIMVVLNHPFSRGTVHICSPNPLEKPCYDPCYLSHPLDVEVLARHTQYLKKITNTGPFSALLKPDSRIPEKSDFTNLQQMRELVKDRLFTTFHPAGTCAMMPRQLGGVVNERLLVYGTQNLRVVDASVFPIETLGNIQATVYALSEKAADIIKEAWNNKS